MSFTPFQPTNPFTMANFNNALEQIDNSKVGIFGPVIVNVPVSWSGSGPWTQTITVAGVTAAMEGLNIYPINIPDATARKAYEAAYGCLAPEFDTVDGGIMLTCYDKAPTTAFQIKLQGVSV